MPFFCEGLMTHSVIARVIATDEAITFIRSLHEQHGALMFFQSGGCCDGSSPMCYALGDFGLSDTDVFMGLLDGALFTWAPSSSSIGNIPNSSSMSYREWEACSRSTMAPESAF